MQRDIVKGGSKVIMRRVKQQWGSFTDEDIAEIQGFYADYDQKLKMEYRQHKDHHLKQLNS